MGRWEPDARMRLVRAAIDLFAERGYDDTTVVEIAGRAGLTKATFFRHFPDKREVLFAGQHTHGELVAEGIAAAPDAAGPLEAVAAGLDALTASFTAEQREFGPRLLAVVAGHDELQERAALKRDHLMAAMRQALAGRGVPDPTAWLAADLGAHAFHQAFGRWVDTDGDEILPELARQELEQLRTSITALAGGREPA